MRIFFLVMALVAVFAIGICNGQQLGVVVVTEKETAKKATVATTMASSTASASSSSVAASSAGGTGAGAGARNVKKHPEFVPTHEWKEVLPDQGIPAVSSVLLFFFFFFDFFFVSKQMI
jgi:hypothetical protein